MAFDISPLEGRINIDTIKSLSQKAHSNRAFCETLFKAMANEDSRTSNNAAWVLTHLPQTDNKIINNHRTYLTEMATTTESSTMRRLTLTLLERLSWPEDMIEVELLNFCFDKLSNPNEDVGIRVLAIKIAKKMSSNYPELSSELKAYLQLIEKEELKPGLRYCIKKCINAKM